MQLLMQRPSLSVFIFLQILDVLTTLIGLRLGAGEASLFISRLMSIGPLPALMVSKILAVVPVGVCGGRDPPVVVVADFWVGGLGACDLPLVCAPGGER